jgi:hypothetical protein
VVLVTGRSCVPEPHGWLHAPQAPVVQTQFSGGGFAMSLHVLSVQQNLPASHSFLVAPEAHLQLKFGIALVSLVMQLVVLYQGKYKGEPSNGQIPHELAQSPAIPPGISLHAAPLLNMSEGQNLFNTLIVPSSFAFESPFMSQHIGSFLEQG